MIDLLGKAMLSTMQLARGFDLYESLLSLPVRTPRKVYAVLIYLSVPFFVVLLDLFDLNRRSRYFPLPF